MNAIIWADPAVRLKKHAELMALRADNARLRAALEAALDALREAPEPEDVDLGPNCCQRCDEYHIWYNGERVAALEQAASEVDFIQEKE